MWNFYSEVPPEAASPPHLQFTCILPLTYAVVPMLIQVCNSTDAASLEQL